MKPDNALVSTDWVAAHIADPTVRLVDVDIDSKAYGDGHIATSVGWNWTTQLQDQVRRNVVSKPDFERLMGESGIRNEDCVVLYGNSDNWFAGYAFWLLKLYGHRDVRLMDGGRKKWLNEFRNVVREVPLCLPASYVARELDPSIRATRDYVCEAVGNPEFSFVDVRSLAEFEGRLISPFGDRETAQRGGHIPGAVHIEWDEPVNHDDQSFESLDYIRSIYERNGITPDKEIITYCLIGERAAFTWFVLKYLLGYPRVRCYDGSWVEWGNLIGVPIEKSIRPIRSLEAILAEKS